MTSRFESRKQKILEQLDAPDSEYHDLSPKGSIDAPIRELIGEINGFDGIVTTSSCSGRISIFLEGRKSDGNASNLPEEGEVSRAGPGGKGGGGTWLFISHDPVEVPTASFPTDFISKFGLQKASGEELNRYGVKRRFIHLKFEPMVRSTHSVRSWSNKP
jgi:tRNA wybutosine-synthesizing protein 3